MRTKRKKKGPLSFRGDHDGSFHSIVRLVKNHRKERKRRMEIQMDELCWLVKV